MMTLGEFIKELEKCSPNSKVYIEPFGFIPTDFNSYRGYYSNLALGYTVRDYSGNETVITTEQLIKKAKDCIGKTFIGWKGGEFKMNKHTPLWISNIGNCSDIAIKEIKNIGDNIVEIHCYVEED